MLEIYTLKIDEHIQNNDFDMLLEYVTYNKKQRIKRFHRYEDALRTLLSDVLVRYSICKRLGVKNKKLIFETNKYGKPMLMGASDLYFNISHSGDWIICAVDNKPVGVDIEIIKVINFKIAERFFSSEEYYALMSQPETIQLKYFYMLWTLKESYIKAEGKGLNIPLFSFCMRMEGNYIKAIVDNKISDYHFYQSFLDRKTVYAICTLSSNVSKSIYMNAKDLCEKYYIGLIGNDG